MLKRILFLVQDRNLTISLIDQLPIVLPMGYQDQWAHYGFALVNTNLGKQIIITTILPL
jgi:hypothetical protein